jgi:4-amino-4-deoxy-L-arabinose transferase-like glycosyltransferase
VTADWRRALAVAGVAWVGLLALTPLTSLWDRDEPRFAQAAVEMLASGDYLVPTFNGELRAQKPPLIYWLMTVSIRIIGATELAVRFWAPAGMAIAALATFAIGRRLWSTDVALVAMIVLVLNPLAIVQGSAATTDAVLLAAMTTAIACGLAIVSGPSPWWMPVAFGIAIGVGLLTKGPVAIAVPAAVLVWTRPSAAAVVKLGGGCLLGLAAYALWLVPAAAATSGAVLDRGLMRENLWRFLEPMDGHGTPLWLAPLYYPAVVLVGFLPWSWPLLRGGGSMRVASGRGGRLLIAWLVVPLVVFTLAATKLPHYIFPIWPALALVVASHRATSAARQPWSWWTRRALAAAAASLAVAVAVSFVVEPLKPVPAIAGVVRGSGVDGPLYVYGFEEPSLVFYAGRPTTPLGAAAIAPWSHEPGAALLVATRAAIDRVPPADRQRLREIGAASGWNVVNGRRLDLVAFVRASGR